MAFQIMFAYIISLVVLTNPAAAAAVNSDAYAAIFSATDDDQFVSALDTYFQQYLENSSSITQYLVKENAAVLNQQPLTNTFSILQHFSGLVDADKIEFLITLGSTTDSTFKVEVTQGSSFDQVNTVLVSSSNVWNVVNFNQTISGDLDVNITGVSAHTGDTIPTFSPGTFITTNGASVSPTSSYYHTYTYVTYVEEWLPYYDPLSHTYKYHWVQVAVNNIGWRTDTINENPAIRIDHLEGLHYIYQVGQKINGHYQINRNFYNDSTLQGSVLEGYADYPSMEGYLSINQQEPNFATDGISLEELLTDFLINEGKATPSSFDVDTFLSNLTTLLNDTQDASSQLWTTVENQSKSYLNAFTTPYNSTFYYKYIFKDFTPNSANGAKSLGLFREIEGTVPGRCLIQKWDGEEYMCIKWAPAYTSNQIIETEGLLTLATNMGFPASLENILLLKTDGMVTYPTNPYFFSWIVDMTQQQLGTQYKPNFLSDVNASTPISPAISATLDMLNPYEAYVTINDKNGNNALNTLDVQIQDSTGAVIGQGQIFNGSGYVSANGYSSGDEVVVLGNDFYYRADYVGYLTYHTTTTNVSLVLDPNAPTGTNPYVADVTVTDNNGNMAMGDLTVQLKDPSNGWTITSVTIHNGTAQITLPEYYPSVSATVADSIFYTGSSGTATVQYDLAQMLSDLGPVGSNPVQNAEFQIIADYIVNSTAFSYNSATENYTLNNNDAANIWMKGSVYVGYLPASTPVISQQELDSHTFDNEIIVVRKQYDNNGVEAFQDYSLTKMEFFEFWLGMKIAEPYNGDNPQDPSYYYPIFNSASTNYSTLLHEPYSYFSNGGTLAKDFVAVVRGDYVTLTKLGFPIVTTVSWWQGFLNIANSLLNDFLSLVETAWNDVLNLAQTGLDWVMGFWNTIIAPVAGPAIEVEKQIVTYEMNLVVDTVWNVIVQPLLPSASTITLSSDQQNLFNNIFDPSLTSTWSNAMTSILNPYTSSLPSVSINTNNVMGMFSTASNNFGIFSILFNLGGMDSVNWAIDAINSRLDTSLMNWLNQTTSDPSTLTNWAQKITSNTLTQSQLDAFQAQTTSSVPAVGSFIYSTLGLPKIDLPFTVQSDVSQTPPSDNTGVIFDALGSAAVDLGVISNSVLLESFSFANYGKVFLAIVLAYIVECIYAYFNIMDYLLFDSGSSIISLNNIGNLGGILGSDLGGAAQILLNPQNAHDEAIQSVALIEGAKLGSDTFFALNSLFNERYGATGWQFAFQNAQIVFAATEIMKTVNLNTAQANLQNIPVPDIFSLEGQLPADIFVNFWGSILTMGTFIVGDIVSAMGTIGDFSVINGAIQLGLLAISLFMRAYLGIKLLDLSKASNWLIFITSLSCDTLKAYLFLTNLLEIPPESSPEILGIITSISMCSDFIQSIQLFQIVDS